jgi:hypothetical protein
MHPRVVHCKKDPFDVYVGRPSEWGNPFPLRDESEREEVIRKYREWLLAQPELVAKAQRELAGKVLGCWCAPRACHAEVLAQIANGESPEASDTEGNTTQLSLL